MTNQWEQSLDIFLQTDLCQWEGREGAAVTAGHQEHPPGSPEVQPLPPLQGREPGRDWTEARPLRLVHGLLPAGQDPGGSLSQDPQSGPS